MAAKDDKEADEKDAATEGEGEGAEGEGGEGGGKSKKKLIIIVGAVLMLLVIGGIGAYFAGVFGGGDEKHGEEEAAAAEGEVGEDGKPVGPVFFELPQILVNLNTTGKATSFIKTTVTLELAKQSDVAIVQANLPRLMDNYNTFLREMRASDLYGSAGVYRLRDEMLARANKLLAPVVVKDVLFKEILVQ